MSNNFTLGKKEKLKSRKLISELFSNGRKISVPSFRVLYLAKPKTGDVALAFGAAVSSKTFKKAVDRNRIKRLTREAWRLQKSRLREILESGQQELNVFCIYTGKEMADYKEVYKQIGIALAKLEKAVSS